MSGALIDGLLGLLSSRIGLQARDDGLLVMACEDDSFRKAQAAM